MVENFYDSIYLSPHLDDVALSCGGQVYMLSEAWKPVLIVAVMAGDPPKKTMSQYVQELHQRWELDDNAAAGRRAEDEKASRILGADHFYWQIPDCIYRSGDETGEALYVSDDALFGEVHESDYKLVEELAILIQQLPAHNHLVVPLGVGNHVDHQITRQAAERARLETLIYYEEYPYAAGPGEVEARTVNDNGAWQPTTIPLTEKALRAKIEAIAAYESQLSTFFLNRADLEKAIRAYREKVGGERIWQRVFIC